MKYILAIIIVLLLTACAAPTQIVPEEQTIVVENVTATEKPAVEGDTIVIIECKGTPAAIKIKEDSILTIKNADVREHTIYLVEKTLVIPYEGSVETKVEFQKGSYKYLCDDRGEAGIVVVS